MYPTLPILLILLALLSGCGNKGPLYPPDGPANPQQTRS